MSEWISVDDRLPELNSEVITFHHVYGTNTGHYVGDDYWHIPCVAGDYRRFYISHWMELPEPPSV